MSDQCLFDEIRAIQERYENGLITLRACLIAIVALIAQNIVI